MSINAKMTAIADKIRSLLGSNNKMGLDAMATNLQEVNSDITTQAALIAAIANTLANKTLEGGNGGITIPDTITAGDTPVLSSSTLAYTCTSTSATATGISITISRTGTYRFKFSCGRSSTSGTWTTQLYKNGSAISGATATWNSYQGTYTGDISCNAGDVIEIRAQSRGTQYRSYIGQLVACINWDTGF